MARRVIHLVQQGHNRRDRPAAAIRGAKIFEAGSFHCAMPLAQGQSFRPGLSAQGAVTRRAREHLRALAACGERGDASSVRSGVVAADISAAAGLPFDFEVHAGRAGLTASAWEERWYREEFCKALLTPRGREGHERAGGG